MNLRYALFIRFQAKFWSTYVSPRYCFQSVKQLNLFMGFFLYYEDVYARREQFIVI